MSQKLRSFFQSFAHKISQMLYDHEEKNDTGKKEPVTRNKQVAGN